MTILIGYTGFVGSNLNTQHNFDKVFNSKNIEEAFGLNPDICVYAGVKAEKFLANNNPSADMALIDEAKENIKRINPKKLVLISTIDVYKKPYDCNESTTIEEDGLHPYGYNRYQLEKWCSENIRDCHILRLPGLFGENIKKNFIYDLIHILPSALNETKYKQFSIMEESINRHYKKQENGFYKLEEVNDEERKELLETFGRLDFSALNFTDSRGIFQFYNLSYLWRHIQLILKHSIPLINLAVEPVSTGEIYYQARGEAFSNEVAANPPYYNFKTEHSALFGTNTGYIFDKGKVLSEILTFIRLHQY